MSVGPIAPPAAPVAPLAPALAEVVSAAEGAALNAMASEPATADAAPAPVATPVSPTPVAAMVSEAVVSQDSLAPLLADVAAAETSPALPPAARAIVAQILSTQTPLDEAVTGESLRTAAGASGVFLEAVLAHAVAQGPAAAPPDLTSDLKAQLLQLQASLGLDNQGRAAGAPTSAAQTQAAQGSTLPARPAGERPPPPSRDGGPSGQGPAKPRIGPEAPGEDANAALRQGVRGALARVELTQASALPRAGETPRWAFELPVGPRDTPSIAQFQISRDGKGPGAADPQAATWRARFSLDVEPNGPVHAEVSVQGGQTRVILWAERDDVVAQLNAQRGDLAAALAGPDGAEAPVRVLPGAPQSTPPPAGQFLDRSS